MPKKALFVGAQLPLVSSFRPKSDEAEQELSVICDVLGSMNMSAQNDWWGKGEPCEEDGISFCARCKKYVGFPKFVYITKGWSSAFHASADCKALLDGQAFVARRGGVPAPVVQVTIAEGHRNHQPCLICF